MATKGIRSDGAKALGIIQRLRRSHLSTERSALCDELTVLLIDTDLREWRKDPTKRQAKKAKTTPVKKAAKNQRNQSRSVKKSAKKSATKVTR